MSTTSPVHRSRPAIARTSGAVAASYMAVAALPLAAAANRGDAGWLPLAGHLLLLAALVLAAFKRGEGHLQAIGDWMPLAAVPLLYAELPLLMAGAAGGEVRYFDELVLGWERAFAGNPARSLAATFPSRILSELLHLSYLLYYPLIYVPPLLLYLRGERRTFEEVTTTLLATFVVCFVMFVVFPVQGPRYLGVAPAPDGPVRALVLAVLEGGSSRGAAFPSSHVAVAVAQAALAMVHRDRLSPLYVGVTVGLSVGAVYGGFHYAVDVLGGAVAGLAVVMLTQRRMHAPGTASPPNPR